jgi:hypothetical protein
MIEPAPRPEHDTFDALCSKLEDYDSLPTLTVPDPAPEYLREHPEEELDDQILAGLISP